MKLLKFLNPKKDKNIRTYSARISPNAQTSGSDMLLKSIGRKKRGFKTSRIVFRYHHGIAKKVILLVLVLGMVGYLSYKFKVFDYFKITNVKILGATKFVNEKDIKTLAEKNSLGQSIFVLNTDNLSKVLKKNFLGSKNIEVEKKYPNKIKIIVEERMPIAVVYNEKNEYFLIDTDGYVLGVVDKSYFNLPRIKYEGDITVGSFLEKDIIPVSIEILKFADKEELKVSSISFYPKYIKLYVGSGTEVYIGYDKDREQSLKTIGALIKKLNVEGKIVKKIDLRYDKVIVLYD